jgi:hypothetical protein
MGAIYLAPVELTHTYIKGTVAGNFSVLVFFIKLFLYALLVTVKNDFA